MLMRCRGMRINFKVFLRRGGESLMGVGRVDREEKERESLGEIEGTGVSEI